MRQRQTGRVFTAEASCATGFQSQTCSSLRPVHRTHRQLKRYRRAPLHIGAHSAFDKLVVTGFCGVLLRLTAWGAEAVPATERGGWILNASAASGRRGGWVTNAAGRGLRIRLARLKRREP